MTGRAIGLSLALIVLISWWVANSEIRTTTTEITCTSLPIGVVFVLFCLCLANLGLARWRPKAAFSGAELAVVYILTAVGSSVSLKSRDAQGAVTRRRAVLAAADDDGIEIETDGARERVAYDDIVASHTVFDWGPAPKPGKSTKATP